MSLYGERLQALRARIARAELQFRQAGDRRPVQILAVSKLHPVEAIAAMAREGQTAFGENYVQEGVGKIEALRDGNLEWHMIGPLQSNKTRLVAENFAWVHGVDRLSIAKRLSDQRPANTTPLKVLVQVNISDEASKGGVVPSEALALAVGVESLPNVELRGFMGMAAPGLGFVETRAQFAILREIFSAAQTNGLSVDTLSMGMTDDLEAAIAEGSSLVRVGSALFGNRPSTTELKQQ